MKKFLQLPISTLVFASIQLNAQSWSLTGNSGTNPPTNFLGTKDSKALVIKTNNLERMRISPSGLVGMGNSPTHAKLEIKGSVGAAVAMFGIGQTGVAIEANNPEIGFNYYYNGGTKTIKAGYASVIGMDPANGDIYIANSSGHKSSSDFGSITGIQRVMTIQQNGRVGIGTSTPQALLDVNGGTTAIPIYAHSDGTAIQAECTGAGWGIRAHATTDGIGVEGWSINSIGIWASSDNSDGVYGSSMNSYAGYFNGNVYCNGSYVGSDQSLKQNIRDFNQAMDIINKLKPKQYEFRQDGNFKLMHLPQGSHVGLIAQDVEKVLPDLVKDSKFETRYAKPDITDTKNSETINFKALNYTELIPIMIKGMQEQQQTIEDLRQLNEKQQQQIDELQKMVQTLSANQSSSLKSTLTDNSNGYLLQNLPNPFSQNTIIRCYLPSSAKQAQLIVYNVDGKQLKSYSLSKNGMNEVIITANTLSSGEYIYSLLVNGKKIDSKHMLLTK